MDTSAKNTNSPKKSLENLTQILFQLEQNLKDADEKDRKEISRHIRSTKLVIDRIKQLQ